MDDDFDLVELARGSDKAPPPDLTLGGYMERHDRPVALEGPDGQAYTVDVDTEPAVFGDDAGDWVAFLVFLRWAETGAGIMGHVESEDVTRGATAEEARARAMELSLYDVRDALDQAIRRRNEDAP